MAMLAIVSVPGPLFVTVTLCAALVVFTVWLAYVNVAGVTVTGGGAVFVRPVTAVKKAPGAPHLSERSTGRVQYHV